MTLREIVEKNPEYLDMELVCYDMNKEYYTPVTRDWFTELTDGRLAI